MLSRAPAVAAIIVAAAVGGCGGDGGGGPATTATVGATTRARPVEVPDPASRLTTAQLVGQRIISGYTGVKPSRSMLRAVRRGTVGGVILFADNVPSLDRARRTSAVLRREARRGRQPPLLIMIDQEGGDVNRLAGAPPTASPTAMGRADGSGRFARQQGRLTGRALRGVGIDVDLAPVADVPAFDDSFLGTRAFGRTAAGVARAACGFARGLADAGVAPTLKHFPGLGRAAANTDEAAVTIDVTREQLDAESLAYRRCAVDVPLTMISSATYPALDASVPAVLSPATYELLADTGFRGLTISDAFVTPGIVDLRRPALRALKAGLDLVLYAQDEAAARDAHRRLVSSVRKGSLSGRRLRATAARILAFKEWLDRRLPE